MLLNFKFKFVARLLTLVSGTLCIVVVLLFLLKSTPTVAATDQPTAVAPLESTPASPLASCVEAQVVPQLECEALVTLYTQTRGANWLTKTGWLNFTNNAAPCNWYGVACAGGHVTQLLLASNGLSGTLPLSIKNLSGLTQLRLEKNALKGRIPPTICSLQDNLSDVDLGYNGFFTLRPSVRECLQTIDSDWRATQTTSVTALRVTEFYTNALRLAWRPISYTTDGGYYQIEIATVITGPYTIHGQTADKTRSSYLATGLESGRTYFFRVRTYTPPHDDQPSALLSTPALAIGVTQATSGRVLLAAYFAADNDLAADIEYVIRRFRFGTSFNRNVQVLLLVDGDKVGDTKVLAIADGVITPTDVVQQQWGTTELNTGDPAVLAWFLQYARTRYPADRTVVTLIGHGLALAPEVEWPPVAVSAAAHSHLSGEIPPLPPKEHDFTPSDVTDRDYLSVVEVGQALMSATNNGANPVDVLFFDQCFQGNLDALYEVHKTAKVIIASPNYAWLAAAYHRYIAQLTPTATPEQIAQVVIDAYQNTLSSTEERHPNVIFWVRGSDIPPIAEALSQLGDALQRALQAGEVQPIVQAVKDAQYVDTTQCGQGNLHLGPPDELIGARHFAQLLQTTFAATDAYGVHAAAETLDTLLSTVNKRFLVGRPYLDPTEFWDYRDTVTILAPLQRDARSAVAWRASIYRSDAPFTATWTVDPTQPVTVTASPAYVNEGRWDEFLGQWYTDLTPTVGQWCNYTPPPLPELLEDSDVLSLTVTVSGTDSVQLAWTPPDSSATASYAIYSAASGDVGLRHRESVPADRTATTLSGLVPGSYTFSVRAQDDDDEVVALSNAVSTEVVAPPSQQAIYLPVIARQ